MLRLTDRQGIALHEMLTGVTGSKIVRLTLEQREVCSSSGGPSVDHPWPMARAIDFRTLSRARMSAEGVR